MISIKPVTTFQLCTTILPELSLDLKEIIGLASWIGYQVSYRNNMDTYEYHGKTSIPYSFNTLGHLRSQSFNFTLVTFKTHPESKLSLELWAGNEMFGLDEAEVGELYNLLTEQIHLQIPDLRFPEFSSLKPIEPYKVPYGERELDRYDLPNGYYFLPDSCYAELSKIKDGEKLYQKVCSAVTFYSNCSLAREGIKGVGFVTSCHNPDDAIFIVGKETILLEM